MNSFNTLSQITVGGKTYQYHSLVALEKNTGIKLSKFPYSMKVLIENLLRHEDGVVVKKADIEAVLNQDLKKESEIEIQFTPGRVLLQDFTGVPVVSDLAAMRDGMIARKGDPERVNPLRPVDLVIDHSVQMDIYGEKAALQKNMKLEYERNGERYEFLKWGQGAFKNFRVVPPGRGICHQVNLEYLAHVVMAGEWQNKEFIYPDTLVGTDSHTTMINGLGVVGWGVGGIEAEAAMLGQPCTMLIPQVIGFEFTGKLRAGVTATDLVLTATQILRKRNVVGKFVEYFGEGVKALSIADRATVANMAPEYGATIGVFPVDEKVVAYLRETNRHEQADRAEAYCKIQNLWLDDKSQMQFADVLKLDLSTVEPSMAGPARPQDRASLGQVKDSFQKFMSERYKDKPQPASMEITLDNGVECELVNGAVVIAAITSCTNTSNPELMLGAALIARNAVKKGLKSKPWVKTTFAPGSVAVTDYIESADLMGYLEQLGFFIAGYGCATCIGNSGPLPGPIQAAIDKNGIATASVLSGNRNFEARVHQSVLANYLASPLLVVAAAIAGNINVNLATDPLGKNDKGESIYLKDIWPDAEELKALVTKHVTAQKFAHVYSDALRGDSMWQSTKAPTGMNYSWQESSTYIQQPPFLDPEFSKVDSNIKNARLLAVFGDSVTTDHISPAGNIAPKSPAGKYLLEKGVVQADFNSYGSRRGNPAVMIRGTFANVRIKNKLLDKEGGYTKIFPEGKETTIYEAAQEYEKRKTPLVIFAGKEYGTGSSRDWAAKGTRLLGVRAVIAESFERIHRSNLVGMGVLPLTLINCDVTSLKLTGEEEIQFPNLESIKPKEKLEITIVRKSGPEKIPVMVRIDTPNELEYYRAGGILPYVLAKL
ncbi:MAG: aconitate hydratase AcnA [Bdellovibrionota bacterium]